MCVSFKIHFYCLGLYTSPWTMAHRLKREHRSQTHVEQRLRGLFSPRAGMWTSFSQLLFIWERLSPDVLHGWEIKPRRLGSSLVPFKTPLKATPHGKTRIFLSDGSPERMSTPGMAISWILQQLSHAFNLFGIEEPTRQNRAEIHTCWFWLEGFWASTTEGSIF